MVQVFVAESGTGVCSRVCGTGVCSRVYGTVYFLACKFFFFCLCDAFVEPDLDNYGLLVN